MSSSNTSPFGRGLLSRLLPPDAVASADLSHFHPYPTAEDSPAWSALPQPIRTRIAARHAEALASDWPPLPATLFAAYVRSGERIPWEVPSFRRRTLLRDLTLGACLLVADGAGADRVATTMDAIANAVWSICEETTWAVPAHEAQGTVLPRPDAPTLDLFAAETGAQLAWADYLIGSRWGDVGDSVRARLRREVSTRLLGPLLGTDWWWLGTDRDHVNNWNPWIASNLLTCVWLMEPDSDRRAQIVSRLIAGLDVYLASVPADGGCTEGQSYWAVGNARLFDAVWQIREASRGALDALGVGPIARSLRYPVAMHLGGRWMVQHADGPGRWSAEPALLHRYARTLGDDAGVRLAVHLRDQPRVDDPRDTGRLSETLVELFEPGYHDAPPAAAPGIGTAWFDSIEVLVARERPGSTAGLALAVKGGHNGEDHNQNDVGSFSVSLDGVPSVIDAGVGIYDATTFGPDRYDLWTMRSGWHNLPIVNGIEQAAGRDYAARDVAVTGLADGGSVVTWSAELAGAWPRAAGLVSWRRTLHLDRQRRTVTLTDTWHAPGLTTLVLPLVCFPEPAERNDDLRIGELCVDISAFTATVERRPIPPGDRLEPTWGAHLWRVILTPRTLAADGSWSLAFHGRRPPSKQARGQPPETRETHPRPGRGRAWRRRPG